MEASAMPYLRRHIRLIFIPWRRNSATGRGAWTCAAFSRAPAAGAADRCRWGEPGHDFHNQQNWERKLNWSQAEDRAPRRSSREENRAVRFEEDDRTSKKAARKGKQGRRWRGGAAAHHVQDGNGSMKAEESGGGGGRVWGAGEDKGRAERLKP